MNFYYTAIDPNKGVNVETQESIKSCSCPPSVKIFLKALAGMIGTGCVVVGSLAAKGVIVLGTAVTTALAAKILIPVGCIILVVLLAKVIYDLVQSRKGPEELILDGIKYDPNDF